MDLSWGNVTKGAEVEGRDPLASCSGNIIGLPAVTCFLSVIMFHCLTDGSDDVSLDTFISSAD